MKRTLCLLLLITQFILTGCDFIYTREDAREADTHPLILISLDGFMTGYMERNETPHLDSLAALGTLADYLAPVFPSKTFPTHYSIATGLYVENHGIIANSFNDFELDAYFSYGPRGTPDDERWWGGEPIWITAQSQGRTATTMFWPGSEATFNGKQQERMVAFDGKIPDRARIDTVIAWLDPQGDVQADFTTLYFSSADRAGHRYGPYSEQVDAATVDLDALIGYLKERLWETGLWPDVNILITSDHGMAATSEDNIIFLDEIIDLDDVRMIEWNPVAMIRPDSGKLEKVYGLLKEAESRQPGFSVYLREELPERFHFRNNYRIPDIIMIADVPWAITSRLYYEKNGIPAGQHGYDNEAPEMQGFFLGFGPDMPAGARLPGFNMVHLYELMCLLMNIEPAPNDGDAHFARTLTEGEQTVRRSQFP